MILNDNYAYENETSYRSHGVHVRFHTLHSNDKYVLTTRVT